MESKWETNYLCPICKKHQFSDSFEICPICFWENDGYQFDNPNYYGGAINLCFNDYKRRWEKLSNIMPVLMKKYKVSKTNLSHWEYDQLFVPRENIKEFVSFLTVQRIGIDLSFYNVCEKYGYDKMTFVGIPFLQDDSIEGGNLEALNIIFSKNPIYTCQKHNLKQLLEILGQSTNVQKIWEELTPYICIEPNPKEF